MEDAAIAGQNFGSFHGNNVFKHNAKYFGVAATSRTYPWSPSVLRQSCDTFAQSEHATSFRT
jgi:hypothetical protein